MFRLVRFISFLSLSLMAQFVIAQTYPYDISFYWSENDINIEQVSSATVDQFGYIWYVENGQMHRFLGEKSTTIETSSDSILSIKNLGKWIYILNTKGVYKWNTQFKNGIEEVFLFENKVDAGDISENGFVTLKASTPIVLEQFTFKGNRVGQFKTNVTCNQVKWFGSKVLIYGDDLRIVNVEEATQEDPKISVTHSVKNLISDSSVFAFQDSRNFLYQYTTTGIQLIDKTGTVSGFDYYNGEVHYRNGINLFKFSEGKPKALVPRSTETAYSGNLSFILSSKKGLFSIEKNEVKRLSLKENPFDLRNVYGYNYQSRLLFKRMYISQKDSFFYLGTGSALCHIDLANNRIIKRIPSLYPSSDKSVVEVKRIKDWIYYLSFNGLCRYHIFDQKVEKVFSPFEDLNLDAENSSNLLNCMSIEGDTIWIGTKNYSVYRYIISTGHWKTYKVGDPLYKSEEVIYDISPHAAFLTLALPRDGVEYYNEALDSFIPIHEKYAKFKVNPKVRLSSVQYLGNRFAVMSSFNRGILVFDFEKDSLYYPAKGLLKNFNISDIFIDSKNRMWASSTTGLLYFDIYTDEFRLYTRNDGMPISYIHYRYISEDDEGNLYLGFSNTYLKFNPDKLLTSAQGKLNILPEGKMGKMEAFVMNGLETSLKTGRDFISFHIHDPNMNRLDRGDFQYRLLGSTDDWRYPIEEKLKFNGLDPGKYVLEVREFSGSRVSRFTFYINEPFYKKYWFIGLCAILILGLIFYLVQQRFKAVKKAAVLEEKYKAELYNLEMKALQSQMNSHFIFNSLNSIKSFMAKEETRKASRYLNKFAQLIRSILNSTKNKFVLLETEINTISAYLDLEQLRYDNKFDYSIELAPNIDSISISVPPLLIQPFLENAVWHGVMHLKDKKGEIIVKFSKKDENIEVVIKDNGIGREQSGKLRNKDEKHKSYGITITNERLAHYEFAKEDNGIEIIDLKNDEDKPMGTKVVILLPVKTELV